MVKCNLIVKLIVYASPLWEVIQIWGGGAAVAVMFTDTYVSKRLMLFLTKQVTWDIGCISNFENRLVFIKAVIYSCK